MQKTWAAKEDTARPVREYLDQRAADAGEVQDGPQHKAPKYLSETDPQSAWSIKDGSARLSQEIVAEKKMLARTAARHAFRPEALAAVKLNRPLSSGG